MEERSKQGENRKRPAAKKRARHRLMSIRYDVETFCRPTFLVEQQLRGFPLVANERCGSWYAHPLMNEQKHSCYFKSTDGHVGTWNFSLKRLNLNILYLAAEHLGCVILDASASKELPDSFSRTIPIWAAVMNRIVARYRQELGLPIRLDEWDVDVYTPSFIVSPEERDQIRSLIDSRVEALYRSQAIVNPLLLATTLVKPLRPFWITPQHHETLAGISDSWYSIVCMNCSEYQPMNIQKVTKIFCYTAGAADDHESWARHLNPSLFWENLQAILDETDTEDATDLAINLVCKQELEENESFERNMGNSQESFFDAIGSTNIFIGTRRAGRPPECWQHFDAILNVTDLEYPDISKGFLQNNESIKQLDETHSDQCFFYLQLPVGEGKRDKLELERWMAIGIVFVVVHARRKRRVLIHCAQGKDRSVAMAIAVVVIFCDLKFPLQWKECFWSLLLDNLLNDNDEYYLLSGLPSSLVHSMLGREGRDRLFAWVRNDIFHQTCDESSLASKETLRVALLLIQQDRDKADPSRSTMQKLNRFFMSKTNYG